MDISWNIKYWKNIKFLFKFYDGVYIISYE